MSDLTQERITTIMRVGLDPVAMDGPSDEDVKSLCRLALESLSSEERNRLTETLELVLDALDCMSRAHLHSGPQMSEWDFKVIAGVQAERLRAMQSVLRFEEFDSAPAEATP